MVKFPGGWPVVYLEVGQYSNRRLAKFPKGWSVLYLMMKRRLREVVMTVAKTPSRTPTRISNR
jgi:hypothetical protein